MNRQIESTAKLLMQSSVIIGLGAPVARSASLTSVYNWKPGETPNGGLIRHGAWMYGATSSYGEVTDYGTVFGFNTKTATLLTVYSFPFASSGAPVGGVLYQNGILFGSTVGSESESCKQGLSGQCGTVYKINLSTQAATTLHTFTAGGNDGSQPSGRLAILGRFVFGTTLRGGASPDSQTNSGTAFKINSSTGEEKVLFSFSGGSDGGSPMGGLVKSGSALFGTTYAGGAYGFGTVFSINPESSAIKTIYSFTGAADGGNPASGVVGIDGVLYGTTNSGGSGNGVIFTLNQGSGVETVLYNFSAGGFHGQLTYDQGLLYGSTDEGGNDGCGLIFSIDPVSEVFSDLYNLTQEYCNSGPLSSFLHYGNAWYVESVASLLAFVAD